MQVVHRQNITGLQDVKQCVLEPNGTFYVESTQDSIPRERHEEVLRSIEALRLEVERLRRSATQG